MGPYVIAPATLGSGTRACLPYRRGERRVCRYHSAGVRDAAILRDNDAVVYDHLADMARYRCARRQRRIFESRYGRSCSDQRQLRHGSEHEPLRNCHLRKLSCDRGLWRGGANIRLCGTFALPASVYHGQRNTIPALSEYRAFCELRLLRPAKWRPNWLYD